MHVLFILVMFTFKEGAWYKDFVHIGVWVK